MLSDGYSDRCVLHVQAVSNVNLLAGAIVAGMPSALTGALAQYMEGEALRSQ